MYWNVECKCSSLVLCWALAWGHSIIFAEFRAGKVLILPCLSLFAWPGRLALGDRRVDTAVSCCPWNCCLKAKQQGISVYRGHPTLLTRLSFCKSHAAAFYKIPEVLVTRASPGLEIGKVVFITLVLSLLSLLSLPAWSCLCSPVSGLPQAPRSALSSGSLKSADLSPRSSL